MTLPLVSTDLTWEERNHKTYQLIAPTPAAAAILAPYLVSSVVGPKHVLPIHVFPKNSDAMLADQAHPDSQKRTLTPYAISSARRK